MKSSVKVYCNYICGNFKYIMRRCHYRRKLLLILFLALIYMPVIILILIPMSSKFSLLDLSESKLKFHNLIENILNNIDNTNGTWEEIHNYSAVYSITGKRPSQEDRYAGRIEFCCI